MARTLKRKTPTTALLSFLLLSASFAAGQTFEVSPAHKAHRQAEGKKSSAPAQTSAPRPGTGSMGWGSGIEVARQARAAQDALKRGDYKAAVGYAQRAANSAPQNASLWFSLGYAARLEGDYPLSVSAFQQGLRNEPSSIGGLSGLAQTYAKMGRAADAQAVLKKVLAANPKSPADLELAGELSLSSDPSTALSLLLRAEALKSSARNELLIARAYERLNQPEQAKGYLLRAQSRAPDDPAILRSVAAFYREDQQYDLAIATLQKAESTQDPLVLPELAYTYELAGKRKEAAAAYSQAATAHMRNTALQLSAAQALLNVGELKRAEVFLKRAAGQDAENYRLHAIQGQLDSVEDRNEDAIREYQFALAHMPQAVPEGPLYVVQLHVDLAELYRAKNDEEAADREIAAARTEMSQLPASAQPNQSEYLRLRGVIEGASNDPEGAEKDFKDALALAPGNVTIMLNYAALLRKLNRTQEAYDLYSKAVTRDPTNQAGLTALGYMAREIKDAETAEAFFLRDIHAHPGDYVPYFGLGDLYTSIHEYKRAQTSYDKAHELAPDNPLIVASGTNSALEAHDLPIARHWVESASANPAIENNPQFMREHERYLTFTGNYAESADLGYKVIEKLPRDPEAPVYLAYDLLFLQRYRDAFAIVQKYEPILPKNKDLRLIAGYTHAHFGQSKDAIADFTRAIELDPKVATSYMNRGFVENDVREAAQAAKDFEMAIKLRPKYGEAHLGLAYADLKLRRPNLALEEADKAAKFSGESVGTHLARAEAYRQQVRMREAEEEYREALKFSPNDVPTRLALASVLYHLHQYEDSIRELKQTLALSQDDGVIYAEMAKGYAQLHQTDSARSAVASAEKLEGNDSRVLMATGEAFLIMGDNDAAMARYGRALTAPNADRVQVRLALATVFAQEHRSDDAEQQISLAFAEARVGEADPATAEDFLNAAQVLMSIHEYDLAKAFFVRAHNAGAGDEAVGVGLANADLALGQTRNASVLLASLKNDPDNQQDYGYLMAMSNMYQQQQDTIEALSTVARANRLVDGNQFAERTEMNLAQDEGRQLTENVSVRPDASFGPIFEDINIYTLDARLRGITNPAQLSPPRSSYESRVDARYRLHWNGIPTITGEVEERNARGTISIPSQLLIVNRNTFDTTVNGGINPVLHLGDSSLAFQPGLQFTVRRDMSDPVHMDQNLFRQYLYVYSSPFFNWISFSGWLMRETGPFLEENLHSRDALARLDFVVGRPWGRTSLITGYEVRDTLFRPSISEYFTTDSYAGVQHKFGDHVKASVLADYLRSWRVQGNVYAIAQAIRPGFRLEITPDVHWSIQASGVWSRGEGYHFYDNFSNQIMVSYVRSVERPLNDGLGSVPVKYPLRFSFGLAQQNFYDFTGSNTSTYLPVVRLTLF